MHQELTPGWRFVSIGVEGSDVSLEGVNPWKHAREWRRTDDEPIVVAHPSYPAERHRMFVYELTVHTKTVKFAAGEFSNGVWGIYMPKAEAR